MGFGFMVYVVQLMRELFGEGGRGGCEGLVEDGDGYDRDSRSVFLGYD